MDAQNPLVHLPLVRDTVVLKLQVKIAPAKDPLIPQGGLPGPLIVPPGQGPGDFPRQAGGKGDKPLVVLSPARQALRAMSPPLYRRSSAWSIRGLM